MRWSAMGDVALTSAGFESVRRAFPHAEIDLNTLPPWDRLFRGDPRFANVLAPALRASGRQLGAGAAWLKAVARRRYDLIIDFQCNDRSRLMLSALWLSGRQARYRLGNARRFPYNLAPVAVDEPVHALERINRTLAAAGIEAVATRPHLHVAEDDASRAAAKLARLGLVDRPYAVFLPGSQAAGHLKRWGAARYARLSELLSGHGIPDVLVLGGPDEVQECDRIRELSRARVHNLCGQTTLAELVPLCASARIVIGNDTGTAHVAASSGTPMLVLCGPTDPRKVLPAGEAVRSLQARLPCINCYRKSCAHHTCMRAMTPARVMDTLRSNPPFSGRFL